MPVQGCDCTQLMINSPLQELWACLGLATGVLMTLLELVWGFGHWDECSKWQKQMGLGLFFPPFASLRSHMGFGSSWFGIGVLWGPSWSP